MGEFKDPKVIIDSIGDGAVEVLQIGSRVCEKQSAVMGTLGTQLNSIGENIKGKMPDDPSVLPTSALRAGGALLSAFIGTGESLVAAIDETAKGLKSQIDRVIK